MELKNWKEPTFKGFYKLIEAAEKVRDCIIAIESKRAENLKTILEIKKDAMGTSRRKCSSPTSSK